MTTTSKSIQARPLGLLDTNGVPVSGQAHTRYTDSRNLPAFLRELEGFGGDVYSDSVFVATIGIGFAVAPVTLKGDPTNGPAELVAIFNQLGIFADIDAKWFLDHPTAKPADYTAAIAQAQYAAVISSVLAILTQPISPPQPYRKGGEYNITDYSLSEKTIEAKINAALAKQGINKTFSISVEQAKAVLGAILLGFSYGGKQKFSKITYNNNTIDLTNAYQQRLDRNITSSGIAKAADGSAVSIPHDTYEYTALISVFFNGESLVGVKSTIVKDLASGNRADAWYQIRYNSNLNNQTTARRYAEAALFGLYDAPSSPASDAASTAALALANALDVYSMYSTHHYSMAYYDQRLSSSVTRNAENALSKIETITKPAIQTIDQALAPAKVPLVEYIKQLYSLSNVDASSLDATNVLIRGTSPGADYGLLVLSDGRHLDVPIGDGLIVDSKVASGTLVRSETNDTLIGGTGDDTFVLGAGDDQVHAGSGNNWIAAGSGNATLLGGEALFVKYQFTFTGAYVEVIKPEDAAGSVWSGGNQLVGPTAPGQILVDPSGNQVELWTEADGTTYRFTPNVSGSVGILGISGGKVGSGGTIEIDDFDMHAAQHGGFLGISFLQQNKLVIAGSPNGMPDLIVPTSTAQDPFQGVTTLTAFSSDVQPSVQHLQVSLTQGNASGFALLIDGKLFSLSSPVTLDIPGGLNSKTFSIVNTQDVTSPETIQLSLTQPNGVVSTLSVDYAPNAPLTNQNPVTTSVIQPTSSNSTNTTASYVGDGANDSINTRAGSNTVIGGVGDDVISSGGSDLMSQLFGNNVISMQGNVDVVLAANGSNKIYSTAQMSVTDAINSTTAPATGGHQGDLIAVGDGKNTIVGGAGDDFVRVGAGSNFVVLGSGNDTFVGGIETDTVSRNWSSTNQQFTDGGVDFNLSGVTGHAGGAAAANYEGNFDGENSLLGGSDTVFAGKGNDLILLSNGDNFVQGNVGADSIFGGMGNDTVMVGDGSSIVWGNGGNDYIVGGAGNQLLEGNAGNNTIIGGSGIETIYAGTASTDSIEWQNYETGSNYVAAGSGSTVIYGSGGSDTLRGGSGNDTIYAGYGSESITGGTGNTYIVGGQLTVQDTGETVGPDTLSAGGAGRDTIIAGDGNVTIYGGLGTDSIQAGKGTALIYAGDGGVAGDATTITLSSGDSTVYGGIGVDSIVGGSGTNTLYAGDGGTSNAATTVRAGSGSTTVYGGFGIDSIVGGSGTDVLYAGDGATGGGVTTVVAGMGNDTLYAGAGSDFLQGASFGAASLVGGEGYATLQAGAGSDTLVAGSGIDVLQTYGSSTVVQINGTAGNVDVQALRPGASSFNFDSSFAASDIYASAGVADDGTPELNLQEGDTTVSIEGGLSGEVGSLSFASGSTYSLAGFLKIASVDPVDLQGPSGTLIFDDTDATQISGGNGNDSISLWGDNDTLIAGSGNQQLSAGGANSQIVGGLGADTLTALGARATLVGGLGATTYVVTKSDTSVIQSSASTLSTVKSSVDYVLPQNVGNLTLFGTANLRGQGNDLNNVITGNEGQDTLVAGSGNDTLVAGEGIDTLVSGGGIETFIVNNSADVVSADYSSDLNDTIYSSVDYVLPQNVGYLTLTGSGDLRADSGGNSGVITGNAGNDTLVASSDNATLVAGSGVDTLIGDNASATFVVNNVLDVVQTTGYANDTVQTSVNYTLTNSVGTLQLTGTDNLVGTGNASYSRVTGNAGNDTLVAANGGYTTLIAGSGVDTLIGARSGFTTYIVNNQADTILNNSGSGTVQSSVSWTLGAGTASLTLTGSQALTGTATTGNQQISGNVGQDTLVAGSGNDTLDAGTAGQTLVAGTGTDYFYARGSQIYQFANSSAHVEIANDPGGSTFQFGAGITASSLTISVQSANNPTLVIKTASGGQISLDNGLLSTGDVFQFADGSSYSFDQLLGVAHSQPATIAGYPGNLIFSATAGSHVVGGLGSDTVVAFGANDTLTSGIGSNALYGEDDGDVLVGGVGNDSLYGGLGSDTLVAGFGATYMRGSQSSSVYDLTQGGTSTIVAGTSAYSAQLIYLPQGMKLADFVSSRKGDDLVLQSVDGTTSTTISGYFSQSADGPVWVAASTVDQATTLASWLAQQNSSGLSYDETVAAVKQSYDTSLTSSLNALGQAGGTLGSLANLSGGTFANPVLNTNSGQYFVDSSGAFQTLGSYQFSGTTSAQVSVNGGTVNLSPSESETTSIATTTQTTTVTTPVYGASSGSSFGTLLDLGPATPNPGGGGSSGPSGSIVINGEAYLQIPTETVVSQTGTVTTTTTTQVDSESINRAFQVQDVVGGDMDTTYLANDNFAGSIKTGNGNDLVNLGTTSKTSGEIVNDNKYDFNAHQNLAIDNTNPAGAFIQAGAGNDTLIGTNANDVLVAGTGFDFMDGGIGSNTYYVPLTGYSTEIIDDSGDPSLARFYDYVYGGAVPSKTLVLPSGVSLSDLGWRAYQDPNYPGMDLLEINDGNSNVIIVYNPSRVHTTDENGEIVNLSMGVNTIQLADGTQLTLDEFTSLVKQLPDLPLPTLTAGNTSVQANTSVAASSLFSVTNAAASAPTWYQFTESGTGTGQFFLNGNPQSTNTPFRISADQLSELTFVSGNAGTLNTINVSAFNGTTWTTPQSFAVEAAGLPPVISAPSQLAAASFQTTLLGSHVTATDPSSLPITSYQVQVLSGDASALTFAGATSSGTLQVSAADLSKVGYFSGSPGTAGSVEIRAFDGFAWSDWAQIQIQSSASDVVAASGANQNVTGTAGTANVLVGGYAGDTLVGGGSQDTFVFEKGSGSETIDPACGASTIQLGPDITSSMVQLKISSGQLVIDLGGGDSIAVRGFNSQSADTFNGISSISFADGTVVPFSQFVSKGFVISGTTGAETLQGTNLHNTIVGGSGADTLIGGSGGDEIYAGSAPNTLVGGTGIEGFYVNNTGDVVIADASGQNAVTSTVDYTAPDNVQYLTLTADRITATAGSSDIELDALGNNDTLVSGSGIDTLYADPGTTTTFVVNNSSDVVINDNGVNGTEIASVDVIAADNIADLILTGNADLSATGSSTGGTVEGNSGNDTLTGGSGETTLISGSGIDSLIGGDWVNTFIVNNSQDTVVAGGFLNTVLSSVSYVVPDSVISLSLTGSANLTATGGNTAATITANSGDDTLIGGVSGADTLIGGLGNDVFVVSDSTTTIQADAQAASNSVISSADLVMPDNVTNLTLSGTGDLTATGNASANVITANSGNDTLVAGSGLATLVGGSAGTTFVVNNTADVIQAQANSSNTLFTSVSYQAPANVNTIIATGSTDLAVTGNDGGDVIYGNGGHSTLVGGSGANVLIAGTGDSLLQAGAAGDTLISGTGVDTLVGGAGDDVFDVSNASDVVTSGAGDGYDVVNSSVSLVRPENVQELDLVGSGNLVGTGNDQSGTITGNLGSDTLVAGSAGDTLVSGSGIETLIGGAGNDVYEVNNVADVIVSASGAGIDTVVSSVSYALGDNLTNLQLVGSDSIVGTGNSLNDILTAGDGDDTLIAGSGLDTLVAGAGSDLLQANHVGDTFEIDLGVGGAEIWNPAGQDVINFGEGIDPTDLSVGITTDSGGNAALLITDLDGASVTVDGGLSGSIAAFTFASGQSLTLDQLTQYASGTTVVGGDLPLVTPASDTIQVTAGVATALASEFTATDPAGGAITHYQFKDLQTDDGTLQLNGSGGQTFVTVSAADLSQVSFLAGADGSFDDILVRATNGANWSAWTDLELNAVAPTNVFTATGAAQTLTGTPGIADTLTGGYAMDTLVGGGTADTFFVGDSSVVVQESGTGANNVVMASVSYVLPANVQTLVLTGSGNLTATSNDVGGTLEGNAGNDTLIGGAGDDTLVSGTGGTSMVGGSGHNTFVYAPGDGADTITDSANASNANAGSDALQFGTGISASGLQFTQVGQNVLITDGTAGDGVLIQGLDDFSGVAPIDKLAFADGSYGVLTSTGHGDFSIAYFNAAGTSIGNVTHSSDGSTTTQFTNPATGEITGSVNQVGAPYSYTYDATYLTGGQVEQKIAYLYPDGSTLNTDTVYDSDGSYQQRITKSDGSVTTQNYVASTGEVSGTDAQAGASYTDAYDNTKLSGGATESKVTYTYVDGSTLFTDTVQDSDGSVQQSTRKSDGSTSTTDYVASTGEVSGSASVAGAGYSFTYDNTNGSGGSKESKVTYTYTDGSTLSTDTVTDVDGSYQQSTQKSDGSTTTTNYVASTGETSGSVDTAGAQYSFTYDNTNEANGAKESKVTYTYTDGSTLFTDTITDTDGSYQQSTLKGDGSATTTDYVAATGEVSGSVNTSGAPYSYVFDNTEEAGGDSESKVTYTYTDGSTLYVDTVADPDGSYQQSTRKSDGSTTSTNYIAATGETSGSVNTAGAQFSFTYDDTDEANGAKDAKVTYTYTDGSTLFTDTVTDADTSYQQTTLKSDGSTTSLNYVAATGEVFGSGAPAGAGYTYTFDNTKLAAGASESKVTYTFADGSTYTSDTITNADGTSSTTTSSTPPLPNGRASVLVVQPPSGNSDAALPDLFTMSTGGQDSPVLSRSGVTSKLATLAGNADSDALSSVSDVLGDTDRSDGLVAEVLGSDTYSPDGSDGTGAQARASETLVTPPSNGIAVQVHDALATSSAAISSQDMLVGAAPESFAAPAIPVAPTINIPTLASLQPVVQPGDQEVAPLPATQAISPWAMSSALLDGHLRSESVYLGMDTPDQSASPATGLTNLAGAESEHINATVAPSPLTLRNLGYAVFRGAAAQ